ncbi:hypothetical protein E2C01_030952 [Portunus trituberculatus]|uniref:Uncharacterized protein n=1 Tax=Portunus trituberculatus TaxID=210409 RepID=A0A5B7ESD6_PORTR|nr:hypothetical protein [Portunus trituberculatus]
MERSFKTASTVIMVVVVVQCRSTWVGSSTILFHPLHFFNFAYCDMQFVITYCLTSFTRHSFHILHLP